MTIAAGTEPTAAPASPMPVKKASGPTSLLAFILACLLAACSPAHSAGPAGSPSPMRTPRAGDIVLTDADGQLSSPRTVTVTVGQTITVVLKMRHDTSRGVFLSTWTPGAASPLPSNPGHAVNIPPLTRLGGDSFQAAAAGRAVLAAQSVDTGGSAALIWRVEVVVEE